MIRQGYNNMGMRVGGQSPSCPMIMKGRDCIMYAFGLFVVYMALYGIDMFHDYMCGDELKESMEDIPDIYIAQRRWGTALWKTIFGYGYLPYMNVLFFAAVSVLTVLLHLRIFSFRSNLACVVYGLVYSACPVWMSLIRISHLADVFAVSMLLSSLVVYSTIHLKGAFSWCLAVAGMMFAMSIYQTSVFYVAVLWLAGLVCSYLRGMQVEYWKSVGKIAASAVCGWGLCFAISAVLRCSGLASIEVLYMVEGYQSSFSGGIGALISERSWVDGVVGVLTLFADAACFAFGVKYVGVGAGSVKHLYCISGAICCLLFAVTSLKKYGKRKIWVYIFLLASVLYLPYVTYIMSAGTMTELRMYMCVGISVAVMWAVLAEECGMNKICRGIMLFLLGFMMLKLWYSSIHGARERHWGETLSRQQFIDIRDDAKELAEVEGLHDYKVIWVGTHWSNSVVPVGNALKQNYNRFMPGLVQPFAVKHFAAYYGCGKMEWAWTLPPELEQEVSNMTLWPKPGSMRRYGEDIIVKVYEPEK